MKLVWECRKSSGKEVDKTKSKMEIKDGALGWRQRHSAQACGSGSGSQVQGKPPLELRLPSFSPECWVIRCTHVHKHLNHIRRVSSRVPAGSNPPCQVIVITYYFTSYWMSGPGKTSFWTTDKNHCRLGTAYREKRSCRPEVVHHRIRWEPVVSNS